MGPGIKYTDWLEAPSSAVRLASWQGMEGGLRTSHILLKHSLALDHTWIPWDEEEDDSRCNREREREMGRDKTQDDHQLWPEQECLTQHMEVQIYKGHSSENQNNAKHPCAAVKRFANTVSSL